MNRLCWFFGLLTISAFAGCNSDIVTTNRLKKLTNRCVYIAPLESDNPQIGKVISDVIEKEFVRKKIELCDPDTATVFIRGVTFLASRTNNNEFTPTRTIERISLTAKGRNGLVLLSASYDNKKRYSTSKVAKELGAAIADKLK